MKIMNELRKFGSQCVEAVKNASNSVKTLVVGTGAMIGATASKAAVTFDSATQSFGGTFDLAPYYSAIGIVIGAIAVVAAIRLAVGQFKRV
jgi:hypothetical protein